MTASAATLARAVEQAQEVLGRSVGALQPPRTAFELAALVGQVDAQMQSFMGHKASMIDVGVWTPEDDRAVAQLTDNFAAVREMSRQRNSGHDELGTFDIAQGLILANEAAQIFRALQGRADVMRSCDGHTAQCAQTALTLNPTPNTPALGVAASGSRVPLVIGLTVAVLALGALAVYSQKRKHFLDGFHSPQPARIRASARSGAPRGRSYDMEVGD